MKGSYRRDETKNNSHAVWQVVVQIYILCYILLNELIFSTTFSTGYGVYKILFSIAGGLFLLLLGHICRNKVIGFVLQSVITVLITFVYISQHIYYQIFSTPYVLASLGGATDALEFRSVAMNAIRIQWLACLLYLVLLVLIFTIYRSVYFKSYYFWQMKLVLIPIAIIFLVISILAPLSYSSGIGSARYLLLNEYIPLNSTKTLGVPTSMALELRYIFWDAIPYTVATTYNLEISEGLDEEEMTDESAEQLEEDTEIDTEEVVEDEPQIMEIAFDLDEEDSTYLEMNTFFSSRDYTMENEYTGMFEGMNLILITAEAFSDKLIDPELTPTLYMLWSEGFQFENFYTPIWSVSTSDGEFVATTGLLPKSGVWSYTEIADNYMPFAFGNQFNLLGYNSYAFHNHTYTYYNRDLSYPNMGYDYYGNGNGLDIESVWPESDLEMVEEATPIFVEDDQFHVYMLTVSGHLEYNFNGNMMAYKNQDAVSELEYSDAVNAYIACNLELEYALASLIEQLEEAGQLENTVIALSGDHYPYGLEVDEYAELYGKESIDETFELYENGFLLWNCEMEEPIVVDKYCSSLDIAATLSNLFDLEYDSRLFIGQDILSDSSGLVMFLDRSYITDDYMYNANTGEITYITDDEISAEEIEQNTLEVSQLFRYSGMIIEYDYYEYLLGE